MSNCLAGVFYSVSVLLCLLTFSGGLFSQDRSCSSVFSGRAFNDQFPSQSSDTPDSLLPKHLSSNELKELTLDLVLAPQNYFTDHELNEKIDLIIYSLKYDLGLIPNQHNLAQFNFFNYKNIIEYIIPFISKYEEKAYSLINFIRTVLSTPYTFLNPVKNEQFIRKIHSSYNVYLLKLQKQLADHLLDPKNCEDIPLILSMISDEVFLYLKNNPNIQREYKLILSYLRYISLTKDSSFIVNAATKLVKKMEEVVYLQDEIASNLLVIYRDPESSNHFREKISLQISMLYEITHSRLPLDLGGPAFIGVGYDILSVSEKEAYFIEVKSKKDLFTNYPTRITKNEADVALNIHKNFPNGDYHIYLVPLGRMDMKMILDPLIDIDIDWDKLNDIVINRDPKQNQRIALSDFSSANARLNMK